MGALIDIGGQRFGRLIVLRKVSGGRGKNSGWLCKCKCGKQKIISSKALRNHLTKSCGCLRRETVSNQGKANFKDRTGQRFGRLIAVSQAKRRNDQVFWNCKCDCGNTAIVARGNLGRKTFSCGCYAKEVKSSIQRQRMTTHGRARTKEYVIWAGMKNRCNVENKGNKHHGARGIKVCKRWQKFENFFADIGLCPPDKDSIDRYPDNDGDYKLTNCRWATWKEQAANRHKAGYLV